MITLDLMLPDTGGWEILHQIRSEGLNRDVPVIVITMVGEKTLGFGFPINAMLSKPVQIEELWGALGRVGLIDTKAKTAASVATESAVATANSVATAVAADNSHKRRGKAR